MSDGVATRREMKIQAGGWRLETESGFWRNPGMAWGIDESVIRGEIDNRVKGVVSGRLWLEGIAEPVTLQLSGNAHRDLAGCLLNFKNGKPPLPMRRDATFAPE